MSAQLQGASLLKRATSGRVARRAQLQGASLDSAQLQGASLAGAELRGVARWAQLKGAVARWRQLQGASLEGAQLQGASLLARSSRARRCWRAAPGRGASQRVDFRADPSRERFWRRPTFQSLFFGGPIPKAAVKGHVGQNCPAATWLPVWGYVTFQVYDMKPQLWDNKAYQALLSRWRI